jgi:aryl-alcohol dehydrogenase-like predicted oxidoreductase
MRTVVVPGVSFQIPALGFGCGSLTGTNRSNATRLLNTAFDNGVRHFDVARYYGYGEAEGILGSFARLHRTQITITSKFGLQPPARTSPLRVLISVGRRFVRMVPAARKAVQSRTQFLVSTPPFTAAECKRSLDTSLRELKTDYLDFFLLHDYVVTDDHHQELIAFLDGAVASGKIKQFGIGTGFESVVHALQSQPELCRVVQLENSVLAPHLRSFPETATRPLIITYGSLGSSYNSLLSFLRAHRETAKSWSEQVGANCSDAETLAALVLNFAVAANPRGIVLFASKSVERTAKNIQSVFKSQFSSEQLDVFAELARGISNV